MAIRLEFRGLGQHHTLVPRFYEDGQNVAIPDIGDVVEVPWDAEPNRARGRFKVRGRTFLFEGSLTVVSVSLESMLGNAD